jgi:type III secretion system HrpB2-like protein
MDDVPIQAVPSVEPVTQVAQIASSIPVAEPSSQMVEDFNRMMAAAPDETTHDYDTAHSHEHNNAATHFVESQESVMRQTFDDVRTFSMQAPGMDIHEMMAKQVALNYQISMVQVQFNAGVYVAQSSKNGLQTLMKNQ